MPFLARGVGKRLCAIEQTTESTGPGRTARTVLLPTP